MQDRFRLKFWDKTCKNIVYPSEDLIYKTENSRLDISGMLSFERFIPLQCTGLRDKNGKLIFEGNILRVTGSRDTSGYGVVEYLQCGCKFIVTGYLDNPSGYYPRKKGELCRDLEEWLCTEVIGNIYQNPELLEVNNDTK